jgi:hypothetical protein
LIFDTFEEEETDKDRTATFFLITKTRFEVDHFFPENA